MWPLTHPWRDVAVILKLQFSNTLCGLISLALLRKLALMECQSTTEMMCQHWFKTLGDGLVLSDNKPLPEPMLSQIYSIDIDGITKPQCVNSAPPSATLKTNFNEIVIKIQNISLTKKHLKISPAKWRPFCPRGDELKQMYFQSLSMKFHLYVILWTYGPSMC